MDSNPAEVSSEALTETTSVVFFYARYYRLQSAAERQKFYVCQLSKKSVPKSQFPTKFTDVAGNTVTVGDRVYYNGVLYSRGGHPDLCVGQVIAFSAKSVKIRDDHSKEEISREFRLVAMAPAPPAPPEPPKAFTTSLHAWDAARVPSDEIGPAVELVCKTLVGLVVEPIVDYVSAGRGEYHIFYTKRGSLIRHWISQLPTP
jgi:hypothetical protein